MCCLAQPGIGFTCVAMAIYLSAVGGRPLNGGDKDAGLSR